MPAQFFKPAYSQQNVPTYAPLPLDAIQYGAEKAQQAGELADETLDTYSAQHEDILSQLTPQNREQASQVLQQDSEFIDRLSDPEADVRYQDIPSLVRRQARKTKEKIKPYVEDSARVKDFQTRMQEMYDKGDLDEDLRSYYQRQLGDYQGLQMGEDGTTQGFKAPTLVRSQDIEGQINTFMNQFAAGNEQILIDEFGDDPRFIKEIRQSGRSPEEIEYIRQVIASKLMNRPENQQYLQAKATAESDLRSRLPEEQIDRLYQAHVEDADEPLSREEFGEQYRNVSASDMAERFINPYAAAASLGKRTERLRSNPGFNAEDYSIMGSRHSVPIKIGSAPLDFSSPAALNKNVAEMETNMESMAPQLLQNLPADVREQAFVNDEGKIELRNNVIGGVDRQYQVSLLNAQIDEAKKRYEGYKEFDADIKKEAGIDNLAEEDLEQYDQHLERYLNSLGYFKQGPNAASPQEWEQLKSTHTQSFKTSDAYNEALEDFSPEYQKYAELFEERTKQGTMDVGIPSQLTSKERTQYINDLHRLGNHRVLYNAKDRSEIKRDEVNNLITGAERIEPLGPLTDTNEAKTYVAYNIFTEGEEEPRTILMEPGVDSLAAFQSSGMGDSHDSYLYGKLLTLGDDPGSPSSTEISLGEEEDQSITVQLLPRERQSQGYKYSVLVPTKDRGRAEKLFRNENEVISSIKNYTRTYATLNENEQ